MVVVHKVVENKVDTVVVVVHKVGVEGKVEIVHKVVVDHRVGFEDMVLDF